MNRKFLTKILDSAYRRQVIQKNYKLISNKEFRLQAYATYVVDKHAKERKEEFANDRKLGNGFCPVDVLAYCSKNGSIKKFLFEFKPINHFLAKKDYANTVEVAICMLVQLVNENKKDVVCFDIDAIEADAKKAEEEYKKMQEELENIRKAEEENQLSASLGQLSATVDAQ